MTVTLDVTGVTDGAGNPFAGDSLTATVTGGPQTYNVAVSGMTSGG